MPGAQPTLISSTPVNRFQTTQKRYQAGFTYLLALILIALFGLGLGAAGMVWKTDQQRSREAELLFIGSQYRQAIQSYFEFDKNTPRLPGSVADLLLDDRAPGTVRHLRRAWSDPFTGQPFTLIPSGEGEGFGGVASASTQAPLKKKGFEPRDSKFSEAATYAEWRFVYTPAAVDTTEAKPADTSAELRATLPPLTQ